MSPKFKMAAAATLNFEELLPFLHCLTNSHLIWWGCSQANVKRSCQVGKEHSDQNSRWRLPPYWILKTVTNSFTFDQFWPNVVGTLQIRCKRVWYANFSRRHDGNYFGFRKTVVISPLSNQSLSILVWTLRIQCRTNLSCQNIAHWSIFNMAAAAILNFEKLLPIHNYFTNLHQILRTCCNRDVERIRSVGK